MDSQEIEISTIYSCFSQVTAIVPYIIGDICLTNEISDRTISFFGDADAISECLHFEFMQPTL